MVYRPDTIQETAGRAIAHIEQLEAALTASREREKKLADELKRSLDAWSNILDLGLLPENYRPDVRVVIERINRALAAHREAGE